MKLYLRYTLLQRFVQTNITPFHGHIVSAIQLWSRLTKFMITILLYKNKAFRSCLRPWIEIINVKRCSIAKQISCNIIEPRHEKTCLRVCVQVRLKPACSAIETSQSLEILDLASIFIILSKQRTTKALIRLRGCAGWSASLLFAYSINRFVMMRLIYTL